MLSKAEQTKKVRTPKARKVCKTELHERIAFLVGKQICQVCNKSSDLDYPHHAEFGLAKKDDRTMINICVECHRYIHTKGFPIHGLTRADTVAIGWKNNEEFLNEYN